MKGFSSVRWMVMKEDLGVSNAQAWGCPRASPSSSTIISSSLVPLYFYHFMRYVLCLERLALYFSRFVFALFAVVTSYTPASFCVGEKHAPLELELLIGFACLFLLAVSCSFYFLSCYPV